MPDISIIPTTTSSHHRRRRRTKSTQAEYGDGDSQTKVTSNSQKINNGGRAKKMTSVTSLRSAAMERHPSFAWVMISAGLYVLSGVTQPILMAWAKHAGLADPKCQLYMLFYYIGPASVGLTLRRPGSGRKTGKKKKNDKNINSSTTALIMQQNSCNSLHQNENGVAKIENNGYGAASSLGNDTGAGLNGENDNWELEEDDDDELTWPPMNLVLHASSIAVFDIFAQSMCYTGNNLAGPTIFAIIYSSVTIWAAIYSKIFLSRTLNRYQWMGVCLVVLGLSLTAMDSLSSGENVFAGACLILVGSSGHGLVYVLSEKVMVAPSESNDDKDVVSSVVDDLEVHRSTNQSPPYGEQVQMLLPPKKTKKAEPKHISVRANCAIQGTVATVALLLWQIFYTFPRFDSLILTPMTNAGTTPLKAFGIMGGIALANLLHSVTFFQTLKYFPGGATSAGVLKGLQAVMVFIVSSIVLCGRWGGMEMCWNGSKFVSLVVVVGGIFLYAVSTDVKKKKSQDSAVGGGSDGGYISLRNVKPDDISSATMFCV